MSDEFPDDLNPVLRRARYGKSGDGDRFVGLWLSVMVEARQRRLSPSLVGARKILEGFFRGRAVRAAIDEVGENAVYAQLRDAAAVYFQSCITDPNYSTLIWGMSRLEPDTLRAKAAKDAVAGLGVIADSRSSGRVQALPPLLVDGFVEVFGEPGREALRAAAASRPSVAPFVE